MIPSYRLRTELGELAFVAFATNNTLVSSFGLCGGGLNGLKPSITLRLCGSLESMLVTMDLEGEFGELLGGDISSNTLEIATVSATKKNLHKGQKLTKSST